MTEAPKRIWVDAKTAFGTSAHVAVRNAVTKEKGRAWTTDTEYTRSDIAAARLAEVIELVSEVLRELDAFTGGGQPTGDAEDWTIRARAIIAELEKP